MFHGLKDWLFPDKTQENLLSHILCIMTVFSSSVGQLKNHIIIVLNDLLNPGFIMVFSMQASHLFLYLEYSESGPIVTSGQYIFY